MAIYWLTEPMLMVLAPVSWLFRHGAEPADLAFNILLPQLLVGLVAGLVLVRLLRAGNRLIWTAAATRVVLGLLNIGALALYFGRPLPAMFWFPVTWIEPLMAPLGVAAIWLVLRHRP
jgi:hypothetical protein